MKPEDAQARNRRDKSKLWKNILKLFQKDFKSNLNNFKLFFHTAKIGWISLGTQRLSLGRSPSDPAIQAITKPTTILVVLQTIVVIAWPISVKISGSRLATTKSVIAWVSRLEVAWCALEGAWVVVRSADNHDGYRPTTPTKTRQGSSGRSPSDVHPGQHKCRDTSLNPTT